MPNKCPKWDIGPLYRVAVTDLLIDAIRSMHPLGLNVFILRHGEAGTRITMPSKDFERPLTEAGRDEIETIGRSLRKLHVEFDRIVASPLKRAMDTADIVANAYGESAPKLELWDELRPEGSKHEAMQRLAKLRQDADVLIVGHDPYLSSLVGEIITGGSSAKISLKKGGLAKIQIISFNPKPTGELKWLLTPRHLKKMAS